MSAHHPVAAEVCVVTDHARGTAIASCAWAALLHAPCSPNVANATATPGSALVRDYLTVGGLGIAGAGHDRH